ncbi:MAG: hypothetical protein LCH51_14945 [Bacteroidetes bacterium]|nr:hypothetical protein [Bacteroidota bacterium]
MPGHPPKQRSFNGMNHERDLIRRQDITRAIIADELNKLLYHGWNPITNAYCPPADGEVGIIEPTTFFAEALKAAFRHVTVAENTRLDFKSVLGKLVAGIHAARLDYMAIKDVRRKHLSILFMTMAKTEKVWSPHKHNRCKAYLQILFKVLIRHDAAEVNHALNLEKLPVVKRIRVTLTESERIKIREHLPAYPLFWRFVQIFFHSGGRLSELVSIRREDVDLVGKQYKCVIKKGKQYKEVWRPIKTIAAPLWASVLRETKPGQFLFGRDLVPGPIACRRDYLTKQWSIHVKRELGIDADLYSLKHLNLTEISREFGAEKAAEQAGHTSTAMVKSIYDVEYMKRMNDRIREVGNEF